jgi:hypothetical protein
MIELSPKLLIAAASAFVGLAAEEREGHPPDDGAALLYRWGFWSHFDHRTGLSSWPLIETRTADELATVAMARYILRDSPEEGDIFLQRAAGGRRYARAGVVVDVRGSGCYSAKVRYYDATTIEARSDETGRLAGRHTLRVARRFVPTRGDRFIRWAELDDYVDADGRAVIGHILARVVAGADAVSEAA